MILSNKGACQAARTSQTWQSQGLGFRLDLAQIEKALCRKIGLFLRRFPQIGTDVVALLDEWAVHFFEELDYVHEVKLINFCRRKYSTIVFL